jgi:hypothetical protein
MFTPRTPINEPATTDIPTIFTPAIFEPQVLAKVGEGDIAADVGDDGFLEYKAPVLQPDVEKEPTDGAARFLLHALLNCARYHVVLTHLLSVDAQGSEPAVGQDGMPGMPGMGGGEGAEDDSGLRAEDDGGLSAVGDGWGAPAKSGNSLLFAPTVLENFEVGSGDCDGDVGNSPYWSPAAPAGPVETPCVNPHVPAYRRSASLLCKDTRDFRPRI